MYYQLPAGQAADGAWPPVRVSGDTRRIRSGAMQAVSLHPACASSNLCFIQPVLHPACVASCSLCRFIQPVSLHPACASSASCVASFSLCRHLEPVQAASLHAGCVRRLRRRPPCAQAPASSSMRALRPATPSVSLSTSQGSLAQKLSDAVMSLSPLQHRSRRVTPSTAFSPACRGRDGPARDAGSLHRTRFP